MDHAYTATYGELEQRHWWWVGRRFLARRLLCKHWQRIGKKSATRALEIGCFGGKTIQALADLSQHWVGIEPVTLAAAAAERLVPSAQIIAGSFPAACPPGEFDLISAFDVVEHLPDGIAAWRDIKKRLTKDGMVLATVPAYQWLWTSFDELNGHYRRYTKKSLQAELTAAGLEPCFISYYTTWFFPVAVLAKWWTRLAGERHAADSTVLLPRWLNWLATIIFKSELLFLPFLRWPWGLSLVVYARHKK